MAQFLKVCHNHLPIIKVFNQKSELEVLKFDSVQE